jgi:hypothetical protein
MRKDRASVVCSINMRTISLLALMLATVGAGPQDDLVRARQLYNQQLYNLAIDSATTARRAPQLADAATLVLARSLLERFRKDAAAADLETARTELQQIRPAGLSPSDQAELIIALGELLYLDDQPGAAAVEFERALDRVDPTTASRERVLDWWASAVDRQAHMRPDAERAPLYARIVARMEDELRRNDASAVASYWLVAGTRGSGDLERAWDAAFAAWARASFTGDRRAQLRADLDQIVTLAIIPERARLLAPAGGAAQPTAAMRAEWDALKQVWGP